MKYHCAQLYANISTNVNTTDIFPFLAIFSQFFFYYFNPPPPKKRAIFGPIQLCIIANIVSYIMNYQYAKFYASIKKFTIDVIFRWL